MILFLFEMKVAGVDHKNEAKKSYLALFLLGDSVDARTVIQTFYKESAHDSLVIFGDPTTAFSWILYNYNLKICYKDHSEEFGNNSYFVTEDTVLTVNILCFWIYVALATVYSKDQLTFLSPIF